MTTVRPSERAVWLLVPERVSSGGSSVDESNHSVQPSARQKRTSLEMWHPGEVEVTTDAAVVSWQLDLRRMVEV